MSGLAFRHAQRNRDGMTQRRPERVALSRSSAGLSLIEVMVALAIAAILLFGLSQIFVGSKNVYRLQEGMSRVQENARFVLQYLESNVRMAGYMGCGNDVDLTVKAGSPPAFLNHLAQLDSGIGVVPIVQDLLTSQQRFQRPIEAFAYTGGAIDNQDPALGAVGDWTPSLTVLGLPAGQGPIKGSDVLVLRLFGAESTAMLGDFDMPNGKFKVDDASQLKAGSVYALTNCANARVFKASAVDTGTGMITAGAADNPLFLTGDHSSTWTGTYANMQFNQSGSQLNAEVHAAQYLVLYVGLRTNSPGNTTPVLKVLTVDSTGALAPQELADDVEMMKLEFGVGGGGAVDKYVAADSTDADANLAETNKTARDIAWRKVLSVRVALLMRSQDRASSVAHTGDAAGDNVYYLFDAREKRPIDYRFRDVYTTTIALRNRLGNY